MQQFPQFKENQQLICRCDLESILIAKLLNKYLNNVVVGFNTDKHIILPYSNINLKETLFLNSFVIKEGYSSISNTVSAVDTNHNQTLLNNKGTINPNLFRFKHINTQAIYATKCPFSTLLLTIIMLESQGFDLTTDIDINKEIFSNKLGLKFYRTADLLLLPNNMFEKVVKNKQAMGEWYNWVENVFYQGKLNKNHLFYQLYEYVNDPKNIKFWSTAKTDSFKDYLGNVITIDKYLSFDEEQLLNSEIAYHIDEFANINLFKDSIEYDKLLFNNQIESVSVYKLGLHIGEPKKGATHDPFFFQYYGKEKLKYSYNIEKLF